MFKIVTDSTADLPVEYLKEHDLGCMNLSYIMDGVYLWTRTGTSRKKNSMH